MWMGGRMAGDKAPAPDDGDGHLVRSQPSFSASLNVILDSAALKAGIKGLALFPVF